MAFPTSGLVAYWKLDESSGNAADSFASYTLTNNNTVGYAAALINNGADFGTANTNKTLSNSSLYQTGSFSISTWFKNRTEIASGNYGIVAMTDNTTVLRNILLSYNYNGGTRNVTLDYHKNNASDNNVTWSSGAIGTSAWTHLVATYDGSTLTLYANGSSVGTPLTISGGGSGSVGTQGTTLGLTERFGGSYASVYQDETGMWNRALTSGEVTDLYNGGAGLAYGTSYTMTAALGTFSLTGIAANFLYGRVMSAALGTFALTGVAATLSRGFGFIASVGSFALTGIDAIFRFSGWENQTKNQSSFSNQSKNAASFSNQSKNAGTWTNQTK